MRTREVESGFDGKYGFELDRNEEIQALKSKRSQSSALDPTSYVEYPEQIIVVCKDEKVRNTLLKLINGRILQTKDYIKKIQMPMAVAKNYCDCFELVSFDDDDDDDNDDENETDSTKTDAVQSET